MHRRRQFNGAAARQRREDLGFTKEWVAVGIDRSAQTVGLYEKGISPPPHVLRALAGVLECSIDDLLEPVAEEVSA